MRTRPVPWLTMLTMRPLRGESFSVTTAEETLLAVDEEVLDGLQDLAVARP